MADLANCTVCDRVYVKTTSTFCPTCQKEVDIKYNKVYDFIRKKANREATILEVHEATGVEEELIIQFIKEGRLRTAQFVNLSYPCDSCGRPINKGTLCDNCQKGFRQELTSFETEREAIIRQERENQTSRTYYTQSKKK